MTRSLSANTRRLLSWLFWILIWQAADLLIQNPIIFVGPLDMARALLALLPEAAFWQTIGSSFLKISLGFLAAFFLGILLGSLAYALPLIRELAEPFMVLIKSIPVASFVILALIWIGSDRLCIFISFLVVIPMIYTSTLGGLESTDPKLLEMAQVFSVPFYKKARFIYLPALLPYLTGGCKTALGMSWKSGIAAEVIGIPSHSIGEQLYYSKLYLDTAGLFAWTFLIILISALFEGLFLALLKKLRR